MKKREVKKLQLSRETLQALSNPDSQKAVGGQAPESNPTNRQTCCIDSIGC